MTNDLSKYATKGEARIAYRDTAKEDAQARIGDIWDAQDTQEEA